MAPHSSGLTGGGGVCRAGTCHGGPSRASMMKSQAVGLPLRIAKVCPGDRFQGLCKIISVRQPLPSWNCHRTTAPTAMCERRRGASRTAVVMGPAIYQRTAKVQHHSVALQPGSQQQNMLKRSRRRGSPPPVPCSIDCAPQQPMILTDLRAQRHRTGAGHSEGEPWITRHRDETKPWMTLGSQPGFP
jgi:hypothetical protein